MGSVIRIVNRISFKHPCLKGSIVNEISLSLLATPNLCAVLEDFCFVLSDFFLQSPLR